MKSRKTNKPRINVDADPQNRDWVRILEQQQTPPKKPKRTE